MANAGKIAAGVGVVTVAGLLTYLLLRKPPAPPPGLATVYGLVIDTETGEPLADVLVSLNDQVTSTDADGYYELVGIEPGTYSITFQKEGYEPLVI
ncbi:hypothetical protein ES703_41916 [subsurface metagenome]